MTKNTPTPQCETAPNLPSRNPAVERCCAARDRSRDESLDNGLENYETRKRATEAYKSALPDLAGYENVRDFIACVAHGMVTGAIDSIEGPKFLYAAQVALGVLRHEPKTQQRPAA